MRSYNQTKNNNYYYLRFQHLSGTDRKLEHLNILCLFVADAAAEMIQTAATNVYVEFQIVSSNLESVFSVSEMTNSFASLS